MKASTVLALLVLTGCAAPMDARRVQEHPVQTLTGTVAADYATVHRRILDGLAYCFMEQPTRRQLVVHDRRDKRSRTGQVILADVYGKTGESVHWLVRERAVQGGTELTVFVARRAWLDEARLVPRWAAGDLDCGRFAPARPEEQPPVDEHETLSLR